MIFIVKKKQWFIRFIHYETFDVEKFQVFPSFQRVYSFSLKAEKNKKDLSCYIRLHANYVFTSNHKITTNGLWLCSSDIFLHLHLQFINSWNPSINITWEVLPSAITDLQRHKGRLEISLIADCAAGNTERF